MAALEVWYDPEPEDDFNPGDPAIIVRTHEGLAVLLDRVSKRSARQPCPSIITVSVADDPYRFPSVRAGVGADLGYVQINSRTGRSVNHTTSWSAASSCARSAPSGSTGSSPAASKKSTHLVGESESRR
ncbi:Imm1 family immunity protein [Lentzea albidocapillata]|uniref:Uncharacterized protein n=1 Tax=Lentzea albidocapillata TaxID=40571 RepID=A0A1W1ZK05_9PSEU|nr:Imm1 family immunity protein [Lentzea albidocapillata]SMC48371.1 hypothetical protein SAMN05660733_00019 [Lentzea albidocapillata]